MTQSPADLHRAATLRPTAPTPVRASSPKSPTILGKLKSLFHQSGIPPWTVLLIVGGLSHLALNALLKEPWTSPWGLLTPLLPGVLIEAYEIWAHYRHIGLFAASNDPLWMILGRHSVDVLIMLALPLLLVLADHAPAC